MQLLESLFHQVKETWATAFSSRQSHRTLYVIGHLTVALFAPKKS